MKGNIHHSALIIVGLQNDFLSIGNAAIRGFSEIADKIEKIVTLWQHLIVFNEEHPADHISFAACHPWRKPHQTINIGEKIQYLWPIHCVSGTLGALNPPWLNGLHRLEVKNGQNKETESFSAFENVIFREYLRMHDIKHLFFSGFPLEYQLKENILDAIDKGFEVTLIQDCMLYLSEKDQIIILEALFHKGVKNIFYSDLIPT
jgi:nicotinamidase/pyrazinamidase